ncbi:MAG: hypothetical protein RR565_08835 [Erysipelothrix sp.]
MVSSHINISVGLEKFGRGNVDYRVPTDQSVQEFILNVLDVSFISVPLDMNVFAIRVAAKELTLSDTEILANYPITTGDYLEIL